jgi:hypothetical protein
MSIEEKVIGKIVARREMGLVKYGVSMEREDLSLRDWVQHAQEEAMDLAVYLEKILEVMEDRGFDVESVTGQ